MHQLYVLTGLYRSGITSATLVFAHYNKNSHRNVTPSHDTYCWWPNNNALANPTSGTIRNDIHCETSRPVNFPFSPRCCVLANKVSTSLFDKLISIRFVCPIYKQLRHNLKLHAVCCVAAVCIPIIVLYKYYL